MNNNKVQNVWVRYQIPLVLGYARTVHKAQGMTLNCTTLMDVNDVFFKHCIVPYSIIYTAISRAKHISQISFTRNARQQIFNPAKAKPDPDAFKFYMQTIETYTPFITKIANIGDDL